MSQVTELKSDPSIFDLHWRGLKNFDLRQVSDRVFEEGDILYLREFDRKTRTYTGRTIRALILHVMHATAAYPGLKAGNCIMSLHPTFIKMEGDFACPRATA